MISIRILNSFKLKGLKLYFLNFLNFVYLSFLRCDCNFFLNNIKNDLNILNFKNHKNYFLFLKYIIYFFFKYICVYLGIFGALFEVNGKISLAGSSKTKRFFFSFGRFCNSNVNYLLSLSRSTVNTLSGCLGLFFIIFF